MGEKLGLRQAMSLHHTGRYTNSNFLDKYLIWQGRWTFILSISQTESKMKLRVTELCSVHKSLFINKDVLSSLAFRLVQKIYIKKYI